MIFQLFVLLALAALARANSMFNAIEIERNERANHETAVSCFHVPQNPFVKEGGLAWMCSKQNACMACLPPKFAKGGVRDGFDHFRSQYSCRFEKCQVYAPYVLCPVEACDAL